MHSYLFSRPLSQNFVLTIPHILILLQTEMKAHMSGAWESYNRVVYCEASEYNMIKLYGSGLI